MGQANLDQDVAFETNIKIWFGWLAKYDSVYHLGRTEAAVERLWYSEQAKLKKAPAGGMVGPDEWADVFLYAGYAQFLWTTLAEVFAAWANDRNAAPVVSIYQAVDTPGDDNGFAGYLAVSCTDAPWPRDWDKVRRDNWRVYQKAPFVTWGNAWFNGPYQYWPAKPGRPVDVDGRHVDSVLLIDETLDAATPFEGSLEVRRRYPGARLIAEPGGPRTPTRSAATRVSTTRSPTTWRPGSCRPGCAATGRTPSATRCRSPSRRRPAPRRRRRAAPPPAYCGAAGSDPGDRGDFVGPRPREVSAIRETFLVRGGIDARRSVEGGSDDFREDAGLRQPRRCLRRTDRCVRRLSVTFRRRSRTWRSSARR
jgi:hypothetical protein